ncbi:hypothetical protein UA08_01556 [Talaromyces atroroseus]|uniref:FAD/NAD(P)-binding domain-containing protein n=1 Tax=Talaromyces atroroseus TaxID=1441469 RepID=A0A1Q5QCG6_TALAT|nr:hypothetical protein UA08_01556 [Talaromyces atroroseus]OKL63499.1 hypothetical protein UA08_01556 [Talaromyces atroroseus]
MFDVLIIGGGPAGMAAAMSLGRACRTVAIFDSQQYRSEAAPMMPNVLHHDGERGDIYRTSAVEEMMEKYETLTFIDTYITTARNMNRETTQLCEVTNDKGATWIGRKLILATGTKDIMPAIKGYKEQWGHGIVHCLFCDGYEFLGGRVGVLGLPSPAELLPVLMAFPLAPDGVTIYTNGESYAIDLDTREALDTVAARGAKFDNRVIESISEDPEGVGIRLHFRTGLDQQVKMLLSHPLSVNRAEHLITGLGLETHAKAGHVICKGYFGETSLDGCFAAGDTSTITRTIPVALASGSLAGIGAAKQLALDEGLRAAQEGSAKKTRGSL